MLLKKIVVKLVLNVKVSIRPTGFLLFWYLCNVQKGIPRKKTRLQHFNALKSAFKVPASATPNEVDREQEP